MRIFLLLLSISILFINTKVQTTNTREHIKIEKIVNPYIAYSYSQMIKDANKLQEMHSDVINVSTIGKSVEGRDLLSIKLGKGEKNILLIGSHHAREYISTTYLMKMLDEYSYSYSNNETYGEYNINDLLNQVTIHIVPMLNPDGVNLVQNGLDAVSDEYREKVKNTKMLNKTYPEWKANINGVDLNRQYPAAWEKRISNTYVPSSSMYKGIKPATEPEVKAIMKYTIANNFIYAITFHTKGEIIYWHDKNVDSFKNNVEPIVDRLCTLTGYSKGPIKRDPSNYGAGYENWFRQEYKRPGFCIELTPYDYKSTPHVDSEFDTLVWEKAKYIGLFLVKEALKYPILEQEYKMIFNQYSTY